MSTINTVAAGDILSGATWDGGNVPGSGDTGVVLHACSMSAGSFAANLEIGTGGSLAITGAGTRTVAGNLVATGVSGDGAAATVDGGTLHVNGSVTASDATDSDGGRQAVALTSGTVEIGGNLTAGNGHYGGAGGSGIVAAAGTISVTGSVYGGNGANGESGTSASQGSAGSNGRAGQAGGKAISGSATVTIGGSAVSGIAGSGGGGGTGYADDYETQSGGAGGSGANSGESVYLLSGSLSVGGNVVPGTPGNGGNGGSSSTSAYGIGAGGGGGGGGGAMSVFASGINVSVTGTVTGAEGGTAGSNGSGDSPGSGGTAGEGQAGLDCAAATVGGVCTGATASNGGVGLHATAASSVGGMVASGKAGVDASGQKITVAGGVYGTNTVGSLTLPATLAAGKHVIYRPAVAHTWDLRGVVCECSGKITIGLSAADTLQTDGTTEIKLKSASACAAVLQGTTAATITAYLSAASITLPAAGKVDTTAGDFGYPGTTVSPTLNLTNLTAANVKDGVTIGGVTGTLVTAGAVAVTVQESVQGAAYVAPSDQTWSLTWDTEGNSFYLYVNGTALQIGAADGLVIYAGNPTLQDYINNVLSLTGISVSGSAGAFTITFEYATWHGVSPTLSAGTGPTLNMTQAFDAGTAAVNEQQTVTLPNSPSGGFSLTFSSKTTTLIPDNAASSSVQSALESLSTIGSGNVAVTGDAGGPYTITFQGSLAGQNVSALSGFRFVCEAGAAGTSPTFPPSIAVVVGATGIFGDTNNTYAPAYHSAAPSCLLAGTTMGPTASPVAGLWNSPAPTSLITGTTMGPTSAPISGAWNTIAASHIESGVTCGPTASPTTGTFTHTEAYTLRSALIWPAAGKVDTTAGQYGIPGSLVTPTLDLSLYVLKTDVAAAADVRLDTPRWTGATGDDVGTLEVSAGSGLTTEEHNALMALTPTTIADAVLSRDVSNVEATASDHSLCYTVLAMSESNTTAHAGKLTVFRTNGTTEFCRKTLTKNQSARPITGIK